MSSFTNVNILPNFYQTSSFFPMPVVLISTFSESGQINLGPYSLCFPYLVTGDYSMILITRNNSNTALNIQNTKTCAINFIPFKKRFLKNCVMLGYPGETTAEKMKNSIFTLIPSQRTPEERKVGLKYPDIVQEAIQIFECTLNDKYPIEISKETPETRFILKIDKILMKEKWRENLLKGKGFPKLPVDFGFRDNINFWFCNHTEPYSEPIPKEKGVDYTFVKYAAQRIDPDFEWTDEACEKLVKVPRIFLKKAIKGCLEEAKQKNLTIITPEFLDEIRAKRGKER
ncbi:MAG: PCP reductase family protein [Promethearchaeota archaeon]|jgi:flavin reductase (DIM6/NTAB) family NADH-FMN oxidoreductase RutF